MTSSIETPTSGYPCPPLDRTTQSIRLCTLERLETGQPGESVISVTLEPFDINGTDCPPWLSLSYTWGSFRKYREEKSEPYVEEGQPCVLLNWALTEVTTNLWRALDALVDNNTLGGMDLPSHFWIDAICINQSDMAEPSHQVAMMGLIYSRIAGVILWLASEEHHDAELFFQSSEAYKPIAEAAPHGTLPPPADSSKTDCYLAKPFTNPYWTRIWIIQEIVLPPKIMWLFGRIFLDEITLYVIARKVGALIAPTRLLEARASFQAGISLDLPTLLETYQGNKCTNPLDRIYGLLGILPADYPLKVDYEISKVNLFFQVMHIERHMPKYLYYMYRLAQNLQEALILGDDLTFLIIVATAFYYELQEAKGLLDEMEHPLTELDVSRWLIRTSEGNEFLRDELHAPAEAFGAQLGQELSSSLWDTRDLERLYEVCPFSQDILLPTPRRSWKDRIVGKVRREPWRKKLSKRDNASRRRELWSQQHSITRDMQRLSIAPGTYADMGVHWPDAAETLYMSSDSPMYRRQDFDNRWNHGTTLYSFSMGGAQDNSGRTLVMRW